MAIYIVHLDSGVSVNSEDTSGATLRQLAKEKFLKMLQDNQFDLYIKDDGE